MICCCGCILSIIVLGLFSADGVVGNNAGSIFASETATPVVFPPIPSLEKLSISEINLQNIKDTVLSEFGVDDGARMFYGITSIPEFSIDYDAPFDVGDNKMFWLLDTDANEVFETETTLRYETEHVYFWIENGIGYDEDELKDLVEAFEQDMYPITRDFFGSEFYPGIDKDPHIYIIYAEGLGDNVGGLFSSNDSIHPMIVDYSNGHETFYISADNQDLGDEYTYGVLAHEFQHMIQWLHDRNETSWMNEGFSELSVILNGYTAGFFDYYYLSDTDLQLNRWTDDNNSTAHYGASLLFISYLYDRMGEEFTKALVNHPDNGLESIDNLMVELNVKDNLSGETMTADMLVLDWATANFLLDESIGDGRYDYYSYEPFGNVEAGLEIEDCSTTIEPQGVNQYGVDYISFSCDKEQSIVFSGNQLIDLLPQKAYSGNYAFWSNQGDESAMFLQRKFDFTKLSGEINISFKLWFDIEADYDYLYLISSLDGEIWNFIETPLGTEFDPTGNNYGWGYNGLSDGDGQWAKETVDISQFAGKEVYLGFFYVTDAGVNGEGALIDDIYIPEMDYFEDFENGAGDWEADGFVLVSQQIPQTFELALIRYGDETIVERLHLDEENSVKFILNAGERAVLVVVGTTRYTHQPAVYSLEAITK